jgi:hypothetical protein
LQSRYAGIRTERVHGERFVDDDEPCTSRCLDSRRVLAGSGPDPGTGGIRFTVGVMVDSADEVDRLPR